MQVGSIDSSHGWAQSLWDSLADGGVYGIPRCGLIYQKDEPEKRLVLLARMSWFEELSVSEAELRARQDEDHAGIIRLMYAIGIEVIEDEHEGQHDSLPPL